MISKPEIYSVAVPVVGTLNDASVATPGFYSDENGLPKEILQETPAIWNRKERIRYYLRYLPVRFLNRQNLFLFTVAIKRNKKPIDATNILDLIQNAGNKIVWNDDCQFFEVHCWRVANPSIYLEKEFMVIYVSHTPDEYLNDMGFRRTQYRWVTEDFQTRWFILKYYETGARWERIFMAYTGVVDLDLLAEFGFTRNHELVPKFFERKSVHH